MALISDVVAGATIDPSWGNSIRNATVQVTTSGARPSSPTEGMVIYETDTDLVLAYTGAAWRQVSSVAQANTFGAWSSWTPTLWENANVSATVDRAVYSQVGKMVFGVCHLTATGTGTANASGIEVRYSGLPAPAYTTKRLTVGTCRFQKASTSYYTLEVSIGSSAFNFKRDGFPYTFGSSSNSSGGNVALGADDNLTFQFTYEAA